ncbi:DUF968 domain-containing protein [Limnobaculum sp. M2-1]|uniref:DUF968 domain-containing protein n=1 Tax=Limnobaculum sp. M2-1 TaxID=2855838 RepID=UPI002AA53212|nr:DUF968 domain-containing protein [Limnobaculum sp. M2-1]
MLLTPYVQPDLGIVILKPGRELLPNFRHTQRILISNEPEYLRPVNSGQLPEVVQSLAFNDALAPFLVNPDVVLAAGGKSQLINSISGKKYCQVSDADCHQQLTTLIYNDSAIRLCWHHDNKMREWSTPVLDELARRNIIEWVLERISSDLRIPEDHQLSIHEVCWWAVLKSVSDRLPEDIARQVLNLPKLSLPGGEMTEADITPFDDRAVPVIEEMAVMAREGWEQLDKPVIKITGDEEPPQSFMLRPKLKRWECEKYTKWVKTQACSGCGAGADDPHHIIGHGQGGMGTKAHDLFVIPLCRRCHDALHADVGEWERDHGSQVELFFRFIDRALAIGAILEK